MNHNEDSANEELNEKQIRKGIHFAFAFIFYI